MILSTVVTYFFSSIFGHQERIGATSSLVAKNLTKKLSQPFEELQVSNLEFKLITPKPIIGTYF